MYQRAIQQMNEQNKKFIFSDAESQSIRVAKSQKHKIKNSMNNSRSEGISNFYLYFSVCSSLFHAGL